MSDIKSFLIRMPREIYEALEREADESDISVNKLIVGKLGREIIRKGKADESRIDIEGRSVERKGNMPTVPDVRESAGTEKRLHPVQSVRSELDRRRGHHEAPTSEPGAVPKQEQHEGHRTIPAGGKRYCVTCGVMVTP